MKKSTGQQNFCLILIACICLTMFHCKKDKGKNIPDVSHIIAVPEWVDVDLEILSNGDGQADRIRTFSSEHTTFYTLLVQRILQIQADSGALSSEATQALLKFTNDERIVWLQDTTRAILKDLSGIRSDFDQAFKYYQHYFPEKELPRIYALLTEFSYLPFIFEDDDGRDGLGVSLEMFLGENFPYREKLGNQPEFSAYLTRSYNKDHMVMRTMEVLLDDIAGPRNGNRLIDFMLHQGIIKYSLSKLLPTSPDSVVMALGQKDIIWLENNERNIWAHFLHNELLYETDFRTFNKLVNPSPNAPGMPPDAPGNVGTWLGLQIVKHYMQRHPEQSLSALLNMKDAQLLLEESKYKPPRE